MRVAQISGLGCGILAPYLDADDHEMHRRVVRHGTLDRSHEALGRLEVRGPERREAALREEKFNDAVAKKDARVIVYTKTALPKLARIMRKWREGVGAPRASSRQGQAFWVGPMAKPARNSSGVISCS